VHEGVARLRSSYVRRQAQNRIFPIGDPTARVNPIVVSVEVRERGWHDLYLSLNEPFAWTLTVAKSRRRPHQLESARSGGELMTWRLIVNPDLTISYCCAKPGRFHHWIALCQNPLPLVAIYSFGTARLCVLMTMSCTSSLRRSLQRMPSIEVLLDL